MRAAVIGIVIVIVLVVAGCGGGSPGVAVGPPGTFTAIYETLFPEDTNARCNFCHAMPASNPSNGSLNMGTDKEGAYVALVGRMSSSSKCMGKSLVVADQPDTSLFLQKFAASPPCGDRMPLGGKALSEAQLELIRSWILDGAKDN